LRGERKMKKSIEQILREAFEEIQNTHGIALNTVFYTTAEVGTVEDPNRKVVTSVEVSGDTQKV
jgi:hypothetical protein